MNYKEAKQLAIHYNSNLQGADSRFNGSVSLFYDDGSYTFWKAAFLIKQDNWIFVFTKHHGSSVIDQDDVVFQQFKENYDPIAEM